MQRFMSAPQMPSSVIKETGKRLLPYSKASVTKSRCAGKRSGKLRQGTEFHLSGEADHKGDPALWRKAYHPLSCQESLDDAEGRTLYLAGNPVPGKAQDRSPCTGCHCDRGVRIPGRFQYRRIGDVPAWRGRTSGGVDT